MPVIHDNRQSLLNRDSMNGLRQLVKGRDMKPGIFAVTPVEIGSVVDEARHIDVGRNWREARFWVEERL